MRGIVVGDSAGEHKSLPRAGGNLKPLQLADHFERAMLSAHLRARSKMLPAQKPGHELRCSYRLDLLAQSGDGQAMNAGQQTTLAPLGLGFLRNGCRWKRIIFTRSSGAEVAAQNGSAGFHAEQSFFDLKRG